VQELSRVVGQNASAAEEMAATAEELAAQATELRAGVASFVLDDRPGIRELVAAARATSA
jgi:methyl-accepting chemotaxis protein